MKNQELIQPKYIWFDGKLIAYDEATIHFLSPSLHYGIGVFEGIRCYETDFGPGIFRLYDHLDRFLNSVAALGFDKAPYGRSELRNAIIRTIMANNYVNCYVRPSMFFCNNIGLNMDAYEPHFGVGVWQWDDYLGKQARQQGLRATVSPITRMRNNVDLTRAKISGHYAPSVIAKTLAARAGFDEAILLDTKGYVAECTGQHIMIAVGNTIYTPPSVNVLAGVTRDAVMVMARDEGYTVVEENIVPQQLLEADEVFVCGTAAEVVGVREIDGIEVGNGRVGPIARKLQQLYDDTVHGRNAYAVEWLDQMTLEPMI